MATAGSTSLTPDQRLRSTIEERPWTSGPVELPRGRSAKDPQARSTKYQCHNLRELEESLREYLRSRTEDPEHCSCELALWAGTSFPVNASRSEADSGGPLQNGDRSINGVDVEGQPLLLEPTGETSITVMQALLPSTDPKEAMRKQRSIAKIIIDSIQRTDGYRYSFHNNWRSGEDGAYRFSYYCNDSLLNKDRVANGKAGTQGKRATKPVYDCRGIISVKFSAKQQSLEVIYKHVPIHKTYEERAPVPRRDSKRRKLMEMYNPEALPARCRPKGPGEQENETENETGTREPRKPRKKRVQDPASANTIESELRVQSMQSLLELMLPDKAAPPVEPINSVSEPEVPQPVAPQPTVTDSTPTESEKRKRQRKSKSCAICKHKRMKCDGAKPRCNTCSEKSWPCFFTEELNQDATVVEISDDDGDVDIAEEQTDFADKTPDDLGTELLEARAVVDHMKIELETLRIAFSKAQKRVKQLEVAKARADEVHQKAEEAHRKAEEARRKAEEARRKAEETHRKAEEARRKAERERHAALDRQAELDLRTELERQARRAAAQQRQGKTTQHTTPRQPPRQFDFPSSTPAAQTYGIPYAAANNQQHYQPSYVSTFSPHQPFHTPSGYIPASSSPQQQPPQPQQSQQQQQQPQQQQRQRQQQQQQRPGFRVKPNPDIIRWGPIYGYAQAASHPQQQVSTVNAPPPMTGQQPGLQESYRWLTTNETR